MLFTIKLLKTLFFIKFNAFKMLFKENYTVKKFKNIQERLNINH